MSLIRLRIWNLYYNKEDCYFENINDFLNSIKNKSIIIEDNSIGGSYATS